MLELRGLFQWERFITPSIIKVFYWLVILMLLLVAVPGILAGVAQLYVNPIGGGITIASSVFTLFAGIVFARIIAEYVLIMFRINEHLGAIRNRGQM